MNAGYVECVCEYSTVISVIIQCKHAQMRWHKKSFKLSNTDIHRIQRPLAVRL